MPRYLCVRTCKSNGRYCEAGEYFDFDKAESKYLAPVSHAPQPIAGPDLVAQLSQITDPEEFKKAVAALQTVADKMEGDADPEPTEEAVAEEKAAKREAAAKKRKETEAYNKKIKAGRAKETVEQAEARGERAQKHKGG